MTRRESREQAFLLIFEKSFGTYSVEELLEAAGEARDLQPSEFSRSLVEGVTLHLPELDEQIQKHSHNWTMNRLSRVALSILRLAIYEMLFVPEQAVSIAINEAVELAKTYGGDEDASFVNGVLGGIARDTEQEC